MIQTLLHLLTCMAVAVWTLFWNDSSPTPPQPTDSYATCVQAQMENPESVSGPRGHSGEHWVCFSPPEVSPRDAPQGPSWWAGSWLSPPCFAVCAELAHKPVDGISLWLCQLRPPRRASCQARQWGPAPGRGPSLPALWHVFSEYTHRHRQTFNKRNASPTQPPFLALRSV